MAVTKIRKMSSWTLLIVSLISIVVLGMFFGGGITNPGEEMKEYVYTGLLLNWTSALFFVTIICMVLFAVWQFITLLKVNPKSALSALGVVVAFVAMLFITYSIGDGTPLQGLNADSQKYNIILLLVFRNRRRQTSYQTFICIHGCSNKEEDKQHESNIG